ncbi:MAG: DUF1488 family protein [Victivallaceae bacterium]|nr:DUF1488 family protein [Victivallaceae bacterium]
MNIKFTGVYAKNEDCGINFQAKVDGQPVVCVVTAEALYDMNSNGCMNDVARKYQDNQTQLKSIARRKILNGEVVDSKVLIGQSDIVLK